MKTVWIMAVLLLTTPVFGGSVTNKLQAAPTRKATHKERIEIAKGLQLVKDAQYPNGWTWTKESSQENNSIGYARGRVKNTSSKPMYVRVTLSGYAANGDKVQDIGDSMSGLKPKEVWHFKAYVFPGDDARDDVVDVKIDCIEGALE